jgi:HSP20 family protein
LAAFFKVFAAEKQLLCSGPYFRHGLCTSVQHAKATAFALVSHLRFSRKERYMHPFQATLRRGFSRPLDELRDELDRLWAPFHAAPPLPGWRVPQRAERFPAVNLSESDEAFFVEAELPGLACEAIEITACGDELVISGTRPEPAVEAESGAAKRAWHRRERGTGGFERRIALPSTVDAARVEAQLVDGVLRVTCPKAIEAKPHKIPVRAS